MGFNEDLCLPWVLRLRRLSLSLSSEELDDSESEDSVSGSDDDELEDVEELEDEDELEDDDEELEESSSLEEESELSSSLDSLEEPLFSELSDVSEEEELSDELGELFRLLRFLLCLDFPVGFFFPLLFVFFFLDESFLASLKARPR